MLSILHLLFSFLKDVETLMYNAYFMYKLLTLKILVQISRIATCMKKNRKIYKVNNAERSAEQSQKI